VLGPGPAGTEHIFVSRPKEMAAISRKQYKKVICSVAAMIFESETLNE
jgi:hypothetical protein